MGIWCSRLPCGCMASALLCDYDDPKELGTFILEEQKEGHSVAYENRTQVWAERCPKHEVEYQSAHPEYVATPTPATKTREK